MYTYKKIYLPQNREFRCSLQSIKGIGWYKSWFISTKIGVGYPLSINRINRYLFHLAEQVLNTCTWLEARIKKYVYSRIKELIDMNALKGIRHRDFLTVRGQRTRTNGRTQKRKKNKKDFYV